ncbi:MAG: hypothetical protein ACOC8K_05230, partial [Gemmatimonadota bacterium]
MLRLSLVAALSLLVAGYVVVPERAIEAESEEAPQQAPMTFFITSVGPGDGADLGGLEGADAWCEHPVSYTISEPTRRTIPSRM